MTEIALLQTEVKISIALPQMKSFATPPVGKLEIVVRMGLYETVFPNVEILYEYFIANKNYTGSKMSIFNVMYLIIKKIVLF